MMQLHHHFVGMHWLNDVKSVNHRAAEFPY